MKLDFFVYSKECYAAFESRKPACLGSPDTESEMCKKMILCQNFWWRSGGNEGFLV